MSSSAANSPTPPTPPTPPTALAQTRSLSWVFAAVALVLLLPALALAVTSYLGEGTSQTPLTAAPSAGLTIDSDEQTISLTPIPARTVLANTDPSRSQHPQPVGLPEAGLLAIDEVLGLGVAPVAASTLLCNVSLTSSRRPAAVGVGPGLSVSSTEGLTLALVPPQTLLANEASSSGSSSSPPAPVSLGTGLSLSAAGGSGGGLGLSPAPAGTLLANAGALSAGAAPPTPFGPLAPWALLTGPQSSGVGARALDQLAASSVDDTLLTSRGGQLRWEASLNVTPGQLRVPSEIMLGSGIWAGVVFTEQNIFARISTMRVDLTVQRPILKLWVSVITRGMENPSVQTGQLIVDAQRFVPPGYRFSDYTPLTSVLHFGTANGSGATYTSYQRNTTRYLADVYAWPTSTAVNRRLTMSVDVGGARLDQISFSVSMTLCLVADP